MSFIIGILGLVGVRKKSSALIIVFSVLLVMLACLNISHVLTMRSEHVHTCQLNQITFRNCASEDSLKECLKDNSCLRDQIATTDCKAPGKEHCAQLDQMNFVFVANMLISFMTFSEPTFWALLLLIRMEMTFPITPDEDDTEEESKDPEADALLENKAGSATSAQENGATGSGNGLRWI